MKNPPLDSVDEIDKIARNLLMASKAWGKFPTPVDQLVQYAELQIERGVDLRFLFMTALGEGISPESSLR